MRRNLFSNIKDLLSRYYHSRIAIIITMVSVFSIVLLGRVFYLQIIKGTEYLENHTLSILKTKTVSATRGSIYDRNGNLLAYDQLAYSVTFEDTGDYTTNDKMNEKLMELVAIIEENGDEIDDQDFQIEIDDDGNLTFNVSGTTLDRFRADVYGLSYISDMTTAQAESTADEVFLYLCEEYDVYTTLNEEDAESDATVYSLEDAMKLITMRYAIAENAYQKYIETTIASDVSEETVAAIEESADDILGVSIEEDTIRVYNNSEYFAQLIGYTGTISDEELEELSEERDDYTLTDVVGKSGIEEYCETYLQGIKGEEQVYVDNVGTLLETISSTEAVAGDDVYLTLDMDLQIAVYDLLEQELASILYSKISNVDSYEITSSSSASDIVIPINDVYFALINNNVIDIDEFSDDDAGTYESKLYSAFTSYQSEVLSALKKQLTSSSATAFSDCSDEYQDYETYIMEMLYDNSIVDQSAVDTTSDEYTAWYDGTGSLKEYLEYNISSNNVDTSALSIEDNYADQDEIYDALVDYIYEQMLTDDDFSKLIYKYLLENGDITGKQICMVLYEQGVLDENDDDKDDLESGSTSAYTFIKNKIKNLEITPAQLALDPCNASCVIVNPNDGEVLACVTYPGYDNNKLANSVDSDYYASLTEDLSYPLLNYATQQKTAPGSTFKPLVATAALTEGYVTTDEEIEDEGEFTSITPSPTCWIYPTSTHGSISIAEALRDSCNYFFYEMGYRMSTSSGSYDDEAGLAVLQKYAAEFGLDSTTGIEIAESDPEISDEDAVRSAIGQGTNNFTTSQLARYIATVANQGTCYDLSLIYKIVDSDGNTVEEFEPSVYNELTEVSSSTWSTVQEGMEMVVEELDAFSDFEITVAGKTGTAQESTSRPNHALFVCYAPSDDAEIAVATRIPYGYTSANAAEVTSYILEYYFDLEDIDSISEDILDSGGNSYVDD